MCWALEERGEEEEEGVRQEKRLYKCAAPYAANASIWENERERVCVSTREERTHNKMVRQISSIS